MGMKNRPDYGNTKSDMKQIYAYMSAHKIPPQMVHKIRGAFINDAIQQANDMKMARIMSCMALAIRRTYGFGASRITRLLSCFDDIAGAVLAGSEYDWTSVMEELRDKTGIIIEVNEENRLIFEYNGSDAIAERLKNEIARRHEFDEVDE